MIRTSSPAKVAVNGRPCWLGSGPQVSARNSRQQSGMQPQRLRIGRGRGAHALSERGGEVQGKPGGTDRSSLPMFADRGRTGFSPPSKPDPRLQTDYSCSVLSCTGSSARPAAPLALRTWFLSRLSHPKFLGPRNSAVLFFIDVDQPEHKQSTGTRE